MKPPDASHSLFSTSPTTRRHHGIKAFLTVDSQPLEVYDMKEYEGRVEGCVLGEAGKKFEVVLYEGRDWKGPKSGFKLRVFFGGGHRVVSSKYSLEWSQWMREAPMDSLDRYRTYSSIRIDDFGHRRPFCFGKVPTTEDDTAACASTDDLDSISVIKVEYWRVAATNDEEEEVKPHKAETEKKQVEHRSMDPLDYDNGVRINEQGDKAAFALNASFGDVFLQKKRKKEDDDDSGSKPHKRRKWQNLDNEPSLVFVFKIRSQVWVDNFLASQQDARTPSPPPKTLSIGKTLYLDFDEDEAQADAAAASSEKREPQQVQVAPEPEADGEDEGSGAKDVKSSFFAPQQSKDKKKEIRPSSLTFDNHISPAPQFSRLASRLAKPQVSTTYGGGFGRSSSFAGPTVAHPWIGSASFAGNFPPPPFPQPPPSLLPRNATTSSTFSLPTPAAMVE